MQITALVFVSLSELQTIDSMFNEEWAKNQTELEKVLYNMGININQPYETQNETHRNRFNNIITCLRWVGQERTDSEWIKSGYCSQAALDKSLNNRMLIDLYRLRGQVE